LTFDKTYNHWFFGNFISLDINNDCGISNIKEISVNSSYILLIINENKNTLHPTNSRGGNLYFVICIANESLSKGFNEKKEFENYLSEIQINANWLNINNVWISYTDTGYLPWDEEIKLSRK